MTALLPFSQSGQDERTLSPFRLRDFRLPSLGRPEAMVHSDRRTTRLGYRVQKCSAGRAATRGVIVSTRSQWLLLVYEPHGRGESEILSVSVST